MRILAASLCAALALTSAEACTVELVVDDKYFASIQSEGDRAKQSLKVISRLRALNAKAKDPKKSVGEQLTVAEADEFSRLTQRQAAMMLQSLIEFCASTRLEGHQADIRYRQWSVREWARAFRERPRVLFFWFACGAANGGPSQRA